LKRPERGGSNRRVSCLRLRRCIRQLRWITFPIPTLLYPGQALRSWVYRQKDIGI
jgi:hypothetical protein